MEKSKDEKVLPVDQVEFEYNEKAKFHKKGKKTMIHRIQAEKLRKVGIGDLVKGGKTEKSKVPNENKDVNV